MNYNFPVINTIEDVLPHIKNKEEFIVIDKGDYKVIDYVFQSPETFPPVEYLGGVDGQWLVNESAAFRRECRGLIFDKNGKLISRAFHKFFNYGEKPEEQKEIGLPSEMLEKLDGSMIRPLILDGDIRLATRKGITDVAMQAEEFAAGKENYIKCISAICNAGYTPIFEWCSRKNQIVIDYPEDNLVLLAIRKNDTGGYHSYEAVKAAAEQFNLPLVKSFPIEGDLNKTIEFIKTVQDKEGFVFNYPNGHKFKAKADWYVTLHRAKDAIGREKDLIKAYLTTGVDDILPILPEKYKQEVCAFLAKLTEEIVNTCRRLDGMFVNLIKDLPESFTRKDFALKVLKLAPKYKPFMFSLLPGISCIEIVIPVLTRACQSKKALDEYRWLIGGIRFGDKEIEIA